MGPQNSNSEFEFISFFCVTVIVVNYYNGQIPRLGVVVVIRDIFHTGTWWQLQGGPDVNVNVLNVPVAYRVQLQG